MRFLVYIRRPSTNTLLAAKDLSLLPRRPSDLANYIVWVSKARERYGSVAAYLCQEKLHWQSAAESGARQEFSSVAQLPLENEGDFLILRNDWPYGLADDIVHLIVWSKVWIEADAGGRLTDPAAERVENFVDGRFRKVLGSHYSEETPEALENVHNGRVVWFKNDVKWQSVGALEHIHVFVRGASEHLIEEWTGQKANEITASLWSKGEST